jgi:acyl dehydratase
MSKAEEALERFKALEGSEDGVGDWFEIDQDRINAFADVTIDHQFIHVDPEAAKSSPFGTTIAHGFLTLSMLTHLSTSIPPKDPAAFSGVVMGVNYGFDKVRFVSPVKVGSRIRARSVLKSAEPKGGDTVQLTRTYTVEIDGEERPALVADWITRVFYAA